MSMIVRPFTIVTGMLFVVSGAVMFVVKHQSQMLDAQISSVNQATANDEQSIRVLQAQWALEADPSRLAALASQFTGLQPMKPDQMVTMAVLGSSLPPPGSKPPGSNPEDPVPALPQLAAAPAAPAPGTAPVQTAANAPPAAAVAATAAPEHIAAQAASEHVTAPAAPEHLVAAVAPKPAPVPRRRAVPERLAAAPVHHIIPPRPAEGSAVYMAAATAPAPARAAPVMPMGARLVPVRAVAPPAPPPADDGGSLLGMAQGGAP